MRPCTHHPSQRASRPHREVNDASTAILPRRGLDSLLTFVAVSAVVICTPGQDTALTIRNTLAGGRRTGVATAGGVALGQTVWTVAASAGVVALLTASEPVFRTVKLIGAAYSSTWGLSPSGPPSRSERTSTRSGGTPPLSAETRALRQGVLSNLGNPKMAVFFASLLPQFAPRRRDVRRPPRGRPPLLLADVRVALLLRGRRRPDRSPPDRNGSNACSTWSPASCSSRSGCGSRPKSTSAHARSGGPRRGAPCSSSRPRPDRRTRAPLRRSASRGRRGS